MATATAAAATQPVYVDTARGAGLAQVGTLQLHLQQRWCRCFFIVVVVIVNALVRLDKQQALLRPLHAFGRDPPVMVGTVIAV